MQGRALLTRFSRLVAEATSASEAFAELVDAAVQQTGAAAAALIEVSADGTAHVTASRNFEPPLDAWSGEIDEIGDVVVAFTRPGHSVPRVRPMISDRGLFGVLVLLPRPDVALAPNALELIDALTDLTATILEKNARLDALQRAHAELRATQRALAQTEKLRALGEMAAGVAHDLKNVLNPLSMYLQVLERANKNGKKEQVAESVVELKEILQRGVRTIDRLRDYGQQGSESEAATFDVDAAIEEALTVAKPRLVRSTKRVPRVTAEIGAQPQLVGHREEVVSAIVNLVINAIDALTDVGGTITVSSAVESDACIVRVADTGPGMSPEVERRVFEPFFTTKGDAGTGLGLAMVYACMRHHAGSVELVTAEGKGTTFTLRFPRVPA